jgi:para-nitrobenzyl esterase
VLARIFARAEVARVPYILGTTHDEASIGLLAGGGIPVETEADYLAALERRFGGFGPTVAAAYPAASFDSPNAALLRVVTDSFFACATHDTARRAADVGLDAYLYNFRHSAPGLEFAGAFHGIDLRFVFGTADIQAEGGIKLRDSVQGYWTRFAKTGDPNGGSALEWPKFDSAADRRMNLAPEPSVLDAFRSAECTLWRSFYDAELE